MFNTIKLDNKFLLNHYDRNYIIQGICLIDNYYYITSYCKGRNSIISVYDNEFNYIKKCELYNDSHVGGICYDEVHDIVWISDKNGSVSGYNKNDILNSNSVIPIKGFKKIKIGKNLINYKNYEACSYITFYNNRIYVGNFLVFKKGELRSFEVDDNGNIILDSIRIESSYFNSNIQGICFYKDYVIVSRSSGPYLRSKLVIYDKCYNKIKEFIIDLDMIEQIIVNNNKLIISSESGCFRSRRGVDLSIIDIDKLFN